MIRKTIFMSLLATSAIGSMIVVKANQPHMIFDFTTAKNLTDWVEQSDTVRRVGMSKAEITLQKTEVYQRAVFFALLNPQPNGAGFAGVRKMNFFENLENYDSIQIKCRAQGQFNGFKVVLRHKGLNDEPNYTYEQLFDGPRDDFTIVQLPLEEFKAYYRGQRVEDAEDLDRSNITGFGFQFYGGVYMTNKQSGPSTLEIDWVKAA